MEANEDVDGITASVSAGDGVPGRIRTFNLLIRSQVLYPVELRVLRERVSYGFCRIAQH